MEDGRLTLEMINQGFFEAETYINPVIADYSKKYKNIWLSRVPRGTFVYGQGYTQKSRQFYGGLALQDTNRAWEAMQPSRAADPETGDPGYDACRYDAPVIGYGLEEKQYTIYQTTRRTHDVCLTDIMFTWQMAQQLKLMYGMLGDVTVGEWENFLREHYVNFATHLVANAQMQPITIPLGADTVDLTGIDLGSIGRLHQDMLDRLYMFLYRQCPMAALANDSSGPVYGLVTSAESSNELITQDPTAAENFRYARPEVLIEGFGNAMTYKHFAHIHDPMAIRYQIDPSDPTQLVRVWPYKETPTTIGDSVRVDQEYVDAPFELSVIMLNNVYRALVPPPNQTNIASHEFGPQDNLGDFRWLNIQDRENNLLKEKGFFFARYRAAPEPLQYYRDAVCILHRRCTDVNVLFCNTAETSAAQAQSILSIANYDDDDTVNTKIEVSLASSLTGVEIGTAVTVTDADGGTTAGVVTDDSGDGTYVIDMLATKEDGWAEFVLDGAGTPTVGAA